VHHEYGRLTLATAGLLYILYTIRSYDILGGITSPGDGRLGWRVFHIVKVDVNRNRISADENTRYSSDCSSRNRFYNISAQAAGQRLAEYTRPSIFMFLIQLIAATTCFIHSFVHSFIDSVVAVDYGLYASRTENVSLFAGRPVWFAGWSHDDRRDVGRDAVPAVPAHAEVQRQTVQPDGDQFADDRQRVESNAERVVVVQQAGAFAFTRLLLDQARRVYRGAVHRRRRKPYNVH